MRKILKVVLTIIFVVFSIFAVKKLINNFFHDSLLFVVLAFTVFIMHMFAWLHQERFLIYVGKWLLFCQIVMIMILVIVS